MTPQELNRIKEALGRLKNDMAIAGEAAHDSQRGPAWAYGYLSHGTKVVVARLESLLPIVHPICGVPIGNSTICGEPVVDGRCSEHGDVSS